MKRIKFATLMLALLGIMASCNKVDDEETTTTLYGDAAITGFSLGTMNRYVNGVKSTFAGSAYHFNIDQASHLIFNSDSLPVGTDIAHTLCNVTALNNGSIWIQTLEDASIIQAYSAYDSIDFTKDRQFEVYASNGSGYKSYTVRVNVHKQEGEEFTWTRLAHNADMAQMDGLKAVVCNGVKYVFGQMSGQTRLLASEDGNSWTEPASNINTTFAADAWQNVCVKNDTIFMLTNGTLLKCTNGTDWEQVASSSATLTLKRLIGASTAELYAQANDNLLYVSKNGKDWKPETIDDAETLLPTAHIAMVSYPMLLADSTDNVVMAGSRDVAAYPNDTIDMVWRKIADYQKHAPESHWSYMERTDRNRLALPRMESVNLLRYDDTILAFGGKGIGNTKHAAFQIMYQSRDNGITWKQNKKFVIPTTFDSSATYVSATVDDDNNIWLFSAGTGEVWRGRLNRLGWEYQ